MSDQQLNEDRDMVQFLDTGRQISKVDDSIICVASTEKPYGQICAISEIKEGMITMVP